MTTTVTPDLEQVLAGAAPLIDARVALTGRDREVYETYLTRAPRPGQSWEDALYGRLSSLAAGPPPAHVVGELRRMVSATREQVDAA